MRKLIFVATVLLAGAAHAQTTTYSDNMGRVIGYGSTVGNQTTYSDSFGRVVGYESQNGISSTYSNSMGQVTGYGSTLGQPQPYTPYTPTQMPSFNPNVLIGR
jgi:hypothetical protein